jgi:hypothetical protein
MKNYVLEIQNFYIYVHEFYNDVNGLYKIATKERIHQAVNEYLESKLLGEIHFDSFDRESVRMIIEPEYRMF